MEEEVEIEGTKVEECGQKPPVLRLSALHHGQRVVLVRRYLVLDEYGTEAVEELKGCDDLALNQDAGCDGGGGPPPGTHRHLIEPGLKGKVAAGSQHAGHDGGWSEGELREHRVTYAWAERIALRDGRRG